MTSPASFYFDLWRKWGRASKRQKSFHLINELRGKAVGDMVGYENGYVRVYDDLYATGQSYAGMNDNMLSL